MEPVISQQTRSIATMLFESFCNAQTMQEILAIHRELNNLSNMQPARFTEYFPKIKSLLSGSWKAQALFKKFESRANMKEYKKNKACTHNRVLISGAGPAGLKMAMECQLLGAKVVVLEKRDKFSRNNVVHLWDFVITDMISLGAKTFHGKFCAGSINHISIRQLQYILLKMALLMGVEVHEGVKFIDIIKPEKLSEHEALGWRAQLEPSDHPASQYEFDALVGADGRRNSLRGFQKKELRTKQCIGITANFINRNTEREAAVTEIGGVSYIFAQQFFDDIKNSTNIDLENITYYKDETHYFVMTAKKQSLLEKGVLIQDHKNVSILLSRENVSKKELMSYALEAAQTATKGQLPNMCFAFNHCGEPDVAIFDFSTSFISENASIVYEMHGKRLLCQLIGDSLLEPFWPTGSGCARCFLSAMDAAWAIRAYGCRPELHPLEVIAERESVYRILPQAISTNLQLNIAGYTIDPSTRYINLNKSSVLPNSVNRLYLSDNPVDVNATRKHTLPRAKKKEPLPAEYLLKWAGYDDLQTATSSKGLWNIVKKYRPDLLPEEREENFRKIYKLLTQKFELKPYTNDTKPHCYLMAVYKIFHGEIPHTKYDTKILEQLPLAVTQRAISNAEEKTDSPQPAAPKTKGFSFLRRRKKMESSDKPAEVDKVEKDIPAKGNVEKLVKRFRVESPIRKIEPKFHTSQAIAHEEVKQPWKGYISLSDSSIDTKPVRGLDRHPNDVLRGPPTTALAEKIYVDLSESDEIEEKIFMKINNISQPNSYMGYSVTDKTGAGAMWCPPKIAERHKQDQATSSYDGSASSVGSAVVNKPRDTRPKKREAAAKKEVSTSETETESDEEESDSSDDEQSSATGVSTDSEFACEESTVNLSPPEILVTEAPPNIVPPPQDYPLSRAKSAGGLATKRALELKRKYLLGEPSPPAVRKSDSTSQIDTKLEAFCLNITEFQKMLHPATPTPQTGVTPVFSYQFNLEEKKQPDIPDIIKNICNNVPIDLLTKGDSIISWDKQEEKDSDLETDSLSDESSTSDTAPNQSVPRVEVHDEGGELIQLDSLILISEVDDMDEKLTRAATSSGPTMVAGESESSESCKDATTCALTETELSDWAAESVDVDECGLDVNGERNRNKSPRILSGPKLIHDAVNIESISSHVCGRDGLESELVVYSNAPEYFEFADEGDQDPTILSTPSNEGYLELVDDYSTSKDRSINFIERVCSDTTVKPDTNDTLDMIASKFSDTLEYIDIQKSTSDGVINTGKVSKQILPSYENTNFGTNATNVSTNSSVNILKNVDSGIYEAINVSKICMESLNSIEESPPLLSNTDIKDVSISDSTTKSRNSLEDISPPLVSDSLSHAYSLTKISPIHGEQLKKMRNYSPAICRSVSETFGGSRNSTITTSHDNDWMIPLSYKDLTADDSYHPVSSQTSKVQELKRERDEQTEVVRRLVLERLGGAKVNRKASRRNRIVPSNIAPPPVPPPPLLPALMLPFPEVPPRPSLQPRLSLAAQTSFSDPELNREQRPGKSFFKSISNYFNKRLGPKCKCVSEPDLTTHRQPSVKERAPAVPPLPDIKTTRGGTLPRQKNLVRKPSVNDPEKGDLMRKSRLNELNIKLSKATSDVERARIVASITEIKNLIESRTNMDAAAAQFEKEKPI